MSEKDLGEILKREGPLKLKPLNLKLNPLTWPRAAVRLYTNTWKGIINAGKKATDIYVDFTTARDDAAEYDALVAKAKGMEISPQMYRKLEVESQDLGYSTPKEYLQRLNQLKEEGQISSWDLTPELRRRFLLGNNFSKTITLILFLSIIGISFFFSKNITGNVVGETSKNHKGILIIGIILFVFFLFYLGVKRIKKKQKKLIEIKKLLEKNKKSRKK
jgi:hypothetical protein